MDPAVLAAVVASAAALVGPPVTALVTRWVARRQTAAQVELTDAQADQIRQDIYEKLVQQLRGEIGRLQSRVADLESRVATLDAALAAKSAELAAAQAERDALNVQLAAARAELQAKEREIGDLKAVLAAR